MEIDISKIDLRPILRDYNELKEIKSPWEQKWNMIHDKVFPRHDDYYSNSSSLNSFGPRDRTYKTKNNLLGTNNSVVCGMIHKIVSQLYALLIDPTTEWLGLEANDYINLANGMTIPFGLVPAIKNWVAEIKKQLLKLLRDPYCDFYPSSYQHIFNLFTLGTACREITITKTAQLRCSSVSLQNIFLGANGYGDINRLWRKFELTTADALEIWGEGVLSNLIQNPQLLSQELENKTKHTFLEYTCATPQQLTDEPISPFISIIIDESKEKIVSYSLHQTFPYVCSRFDVASGELYGKTFVWDCMPDICTVDKLSKLALQNADWIINPPILVKDATSLAFSQLGPKTIIQGLDSQNRPSIMPMQGMGGNIQFLMEYYQIKVKELAEGLVANDPLTPEMPNMTATEVMQRKIQSANRIRPMLVRFESEDLNPTIKRLLSLYQQMKMLAQFPYDAAAEYASQLSGINITPEIVAQILPNPLAQLNVHFSGQMAKMQKMQEIQDVTNLIQAGMQLAQIDPTVLDLVDLGEMFRFMIEEAGITNRGINDDKTVANIRKQRAQTQQQQSLVQEAEIGVKQAQQQKILAETENIRNNM